jgi:hypothetical protein
MHGPKERGGIRAAEPALSPSREGRPIGRMREADRAYATLRAKISGSLNARGSYLPSELAR